MEKKIYQKPEVALCIVEHPLLSTSIESNASLKMGAGASADAARSRQSNTSWDDE